MPITVTGAPSGSLATLSTAVYDAANFAQGVPGPYRGAIADLTGDGTPSILRLGWKATPSRARGTRQHGVDCVSFRWFIPACAGNALAGDASVAEDEELPAFLEEATEGPDYPAAAE